MSKYEKFSKEELIMLAEKQDSELASKKYGLVWDAEREPEQVVLDCAENLPVLKRVKGKEIRTNDDEDNILIEGDNYHALTVLNYTHKEKIDVIYIDPPYNTGNQDFKYNDRFVDKTDGFRHSKWLNFMAKRLVLAHDLLKDTGVIFISIDDNEQAQLKMLCDKVFGQDNFVGLLPRLIKKSGKSTESVSKNNDYVLIYFKGGSAKLSSIEHNDAGFKYKDEFFEERGFYKLNQTLDYDSIQYSKSLDYKIIIEGEEILPGGVSEKKMNERIQNNPMRDFCWRWSRKLFDFGLKNDFIVVKKYKNKPSRIYTKTYQNATISKKENGEYFVEIVQRSKPMTTIDLIENEYSNDGAKKELKNIFGEVQFDYPKPTSLIKQLLRVSSEQHSLILDFMAGSGTTGHAVLDLNKEDGGSRKFILCTNNEVNGLEKELKEKGLSEKEIEKYGICQKVTYPRLEKVIKGYKKNGNGEKVEGLGGNLQYFRTALVKKTSAVNTKIDITSKCTEMLCVKENIFNFEKEREDYKIFSSNKKDKFLCIYYNFLEKSFEEFLSELKKIKEEKAVYIFSLKDEIDKKITSSVENARFEAIPHKILKVYEEWVKKNIPMRSDLILLEFARAKDKVFEQKDKDESARLLRIVLEKVIVKISQKNNVEFLKENSKQEKASILNDKLKSENIFSKVDWEENKTYLAIGNNASHGEYGDYNIKQVENFYRHIQILLNKFGV
ncbi:MAG: site-specific DNA-methyltransferase [Candidatus Magasanikbacteria bacterium]